MAYGYGNPHSPTGLHVIDFKKMILARPEGGIRGGILPVSRLRRDTRNSDPAKSGIQNLFIEVYIPAGSLFRRFKPLVCVICFDWEKTYAKTALPEDREKISSFSPIKASLSRGLARDEDKTAMNSKYSSVSGSIEEKTAWAAEIYQTFGSHLLKDKKLADFLEKIKHAIRASREKMMETGISALCMQCEHDEGGSCCGKGMENRYDGWLILINLLLDIYIPRTRRDSRSCFFLGENGCLLQVRHVICINYICKKITDRIDPARINALREKEGEEVTLLFLLNEHVKKVLKRQPGYHGRKS